MNLLPPGILDTAYHGPLGATALCVALGAVFILAGHTSTSTTTTAVSQALFGTDTACFVMISAVLLWLLTTSQGKEVLLSRLIWCVPGLTPVGTVIPLVTLWTALLVLLDAALTTTSPIKAPAPPARSLAFITPLRGLSSLFVFTHHFVLDLLVLAALSTEVILAVGHYLPYTTSWLRHPALQLLWGGGPLLVRLFSLITGRVVVVRYLRGGKVVDLVQAMVQRYCRLFLTLLVALIGYAALTHLGAQAFIERARDISGSPRLRFTVTGQPMEQLTLRQCFDRVAQMMSLDLRSPAPSDLSVLWTIPGTIKPSMYILALAPFLFALRLPIRLAVYTTLYLFFQPCPTEPRYRWLEPTLLGLALADVDESTTTLRRLPLSRSRSVQLGLWALRAYLVAIWATGQMWFYGGDYSVDGPDQRRFEGAFCIFLLLHLTPSACSALERCRPLEALGRLSFSMYLWHSFCISTIGTALLVHLHDYGGPGFMASMACVFVAVLTASIVLSYVFHVEVEKPVNRAMSWLCKVLLADSLPMGRIEEEESRPQAPEGTK